MDHDEDMTLEELILEDIKEWCEHYVFGESWDDHMGRLKPKEYSKRLEEVMKIYFRDHIFPIEDYCN